MWNAAREIDQHDRGPWITTSVFAVRSDRRERRRSPRRWLTGAAARVSRAGAVIREIGEDSAISFRRWP